MSTKTLPTDLALRTRWYLRLRFFLLIALVTSGVLPQLLIEGWSGQVRSDAAIGLAAIASSGVFYALSFLLKRETYHRVLAVSLIVFDITANMLLIHTNGGVESRDHIMFAIPILMSAVLFGRLAAYLTSLCSVVAYGAIIWADYFDLITNKGTHTSLNDDLTTALDATILISTVLMVLGYLANHFAHLLLAKERQATAATEALKRAQSIAHLGSWEWDAQSDKATWSEEIYKIYGMKPTSQPLHLDATLKKIHPDDREHFRSTLTLAVEQGRRFNMDYRIVRAGGKVRYLKAEGQVEMNRHGKPVRLYGTLWDVTVAQSLEAAKSDFVALASHQLRTPASAVKILLGLLAEGYAGKLSTKQYELIRNAYLENERQLKIANDLLHVATIETGRMKLKKSKLKLQDWLEPIVAEHHAIITDRQQKFVTRLLKKPLYIRADAEKLHMVLDNLLSNACKYTPEGGTISLTLGVSKTYARINIKDTGMGIPKAEQLRIFQKFVRLNQRSGDRVEGSGLGLYLVESIVKLHKGVITVKSRPKAGTTFTILLPLSKA